MPALTKQAFNGQFGYRRIHVILGRQGHEFSAKTQQNDVMSKTVLLQTSQKKQFAHKSHAHAGRFNPDVPWLN
ncbi:MAG: hypothetical protein IT486_09790 [Gammaproteobacteria bacterium]|nr:hypothetical protein [Gammaproteobacteria bacterium]